MVNSIAVKNNVVFTSHKGTLTRFENGEKQTKEIDLRKIKFYGDNFLIGIVNDSKDVCVLDCEKLNIIAKHTFPKRPSAFTTCQDFIIVSDKFGDVFKAKIFEDHTHTETNLDGFGSAIIGHVSMVLALAATNDFIFSSDRDEHIRISEFPKSYIIDKFLLNHENFVSHLVLHDSNLLLSCGGDSYALLWDWQKGVLLRKIELGVEGVISVVISNNKVYFASENSQVVICYDFPKFETKNLIDTGSLVYCLAADDEVYYGNSRGYAKLNTELVEVGEEEEYVVSEANYRKR